MKLDGNPVIRETLIGFQRTYEELKHYILELLSGNDAGFQRTYEELKLQHFKPASCLPFSFQRTYEELKLGTGADGEPVLKVVFSVPMRN